jgi:hypothetical protein
MQKKHRKDINEDVRKILEQMKTQGDKAAREGAKAAVLKLRLVFLFVSFLNISTRRLVKTI